MPLTLHRSRSLPASLPKNSKDLHLLDFSPFPLPENGYCLEVEVQDKISQGRTGMVFPVKCLRITSPAGAPQHQLELPQSLCIKVAKPQFCRSLARETWFYDYMARADATMGVVVPQCFGMFAGRMETPWTKVKEHSKRYASGQSTWDKGSDEEQPPESPGVAWFKDDKGHIDGATFWNDSTLKSQSPWDTWMPSDESNEIAVLVLEQLGRQFYTYDEERETPGYNLLDDVREIAEDPSYLNVRHNDLRYCNVLRAVDSNPLRFCPRRNKVHEWRIIDFDRTQIQVGSRSQQDSVGEAYFWDFDLY